MVDKENTIGIVIIGLLLIYALTHNGVTDEVKERIQATDDVQITDMLIKDSNGEVNTMQDYNYRIKNIFIQIFK